MTRGNAGFGESFAECFTVWVDKRYHDGNTVGKEGTSGKLPSAAETFMKKWFPYKETKTKSWSVNIEEG